MTIAEERRKTCDGDGVGHGRNGGVRFLPMGSFDAGGFEPVVRVNGAGSWGDGGPGWVEVTIGDRDRVAWHCDPAYLMIFLMLVRTEPCYFHADTSLLACGDPEIRRFLSISFDVPTPCRRYPLGRVPEVAG